MNGDDSFQVLALTNTNALAGIALSADLVGQIQKACCALTPHFVDTSLAGSDGTLNGWFANNSSATDFPMLDLDSLQNVPAGFFDCGASWASFSSSNDWQVLTNVLTQLIWTRQNTIAQNLDTRGAYVEGGSYAENIQSVTAIYQTNTTDMLQSNVVASGSCISCEIPPYSWNDPPGGEPSQAMMGNFRFNTIISNAVTNIQFNAATYIFPSQWAVFDANGQFPNGAMPQLIQSQSGQSTGGVFIATSYFGGNAPLSNAVPVACAENAARGYSATFKTLLKWDGPGGFTVK